MAKEDVVDMPAAPPRKRRALETLPDVWIARWLASDHLSAGDRKRLEEVKAERKQARPDRVLGLLIGQEGMTPEQLRLVKGEIDKADATEFRYVRVAGALHVHCKRIAPVAREASLEAVVRGADAVIAAPKELREPKSMDASPVWAAVRLARHRSVPVKIVMPDGSLN